MGEKKGKKTFSPHGATAPSGPRVSSLRLQNHTQTHKDPSGLAIGPMLRPLADNLQHPQARQPAMPQAGFELTIPARDWPQTHALDYVDTGIWGGERA